MTRTTTMTVALLVASCQDNDAYLRARIEGLTQEIASLKQAAEAHPSVDSAVDAGTSEEEVKPTSPYQHFSPVTDTVTVNVTCGRDSEGTLIKRANFKIVVPPEAFKSCRAGGERQLRVVDLKDDASYSQLLGLFKADHLVPAGKSEGLAWVVNTRPDQYSFSLPASVATVAGVGCSRAMKSMLTMRGDKHQGNELNASIGGFDQHFPNFIGGFDRFLVIVPGK